MYLIFITLTFQFLMEVLAVKVRFYVLSVDLSHCSLLLFHNFCQKTSY